MNKKTNPRNKPLNHREYMRRCLLIFLTVLCDKEHATPETLRRVWDEIQELSGSINRGYVSYEDLARVLKNEYGVEVK